MSRIYIRIGLCVLGAIVLPFHYAYAEEVLLLENDSSRSFAAQILIINKSDRDDDNVLQFGSTLNERLYWDTTLGQFALTDDLEVQGTLLVKDKLKFTQDDGNEYIDSLADGYMDYGATTGHRFNNNVHITGAGGANRLFTVESNSSYGGLTLKAPTEQNVFIELMEDTVKRGGFEYDNTTDKTYLASFGGHTLVLSSNDDSTPTDHITIANDGVALFANKIALTQTDGNEYIDSLADGYMDYGATTAHRFNTDDLVVDVANNRVGIGTAAAATLLDISDTTPVFRLTNEQSLSAPNWNGVTIGDIDFYTSDGSGGGTEVISRIRSVVDVDGTNDPNAALAFWAGETSDFTEKMRIKSNGDVGIGTVTPGDKLTVLGGNIAVRELDDGADAVVIGSGNANGWQAIKANGSDTIVFDGATNNDSYFNTGGGLGIGETTPEAKLEVTDTLRMLSTAFSAPTTGKGLELRYNSTNDTGQIYSYDRDGAAYKPLYYAGSNVEFHPNGSTQAMFDVSTQGITAQHAATGVTHDDRFVDFKYDDASLAPASIWSQFIFERNNNYFLEMISPSTAYTGILFADGAEAGRIKYDHATDLMEIYATNAILAAQKIAFTQTDGNEYIDSLADGYMDYGATTAHRFNTDDLVVDVANNRVGIQTAAPTYTLDIDAKAYQWAMRTKGSYYTTNTFQVNSDTAASRGMFQGARSRGTDASPTAVQDGDYLFSLLGAGWDGAGYDTDAEIDIMATQTHNATSHGASIRFQTTPNDSATQAIRMLIDQDGDVGIGTDSPDAKLDIFGTTDFGLKFSTSTENASNWIKFQESDTDVMTIGYDGVDNQLEFNSSLLVIKRTGPVGIGTATPTGKLHIDQASTSGAIPVLRLDQGDIDDTFIDFIGTSAADGTRSISSDTTEDSAKFGAIRVEINGTTKWLRVYDSES